jgi:hypothetical protein
MKTRLFAALVAYAVLAALAAYTLGDAALPVGDRAVKLRDAVWILLGGFALKTLIAYGRYRAEKSDEGPTDMHDSDE